MVTKLYIRGLDQNLGSHMIIYPLANGFPFLLPSSEMRKNQMVNSVCLITLQRSWTIVTILGGKQLRRHMLS